MRHSSECKTHNFPCSFLYFAHLFCFHVSSVGVLPQASSSASQQLLEQWQTSSQDGKISEDIQPKEEQPHSQSEQPSSQTEPTQQAYGAKDQDQQGSSQSKHDQPQVQQEHSHSDQKIPERNTSQSVEKDQVKTSEQASFQFPKRESNTQHSESHQQNIHHQLNVEQQTTAANEANNAAKRMKGSPSIPFQLLIPIIRPHLDKDRNMQLQSVFAKLRVYFSNMIVLDFCPLLLPKSPCHSSSSYSNLAKEKNWFSERI